MYLKASICNKNELFLYDSKLIIPLPLSEKYWIAQLKKRSQERTRDYNGMLLIR